jgi:toxin ParE1/3/4
MSADRLSTLRQWPIRGFENYLIFYLPTEAGIDVLRVLHGARDIDRILREEVNGEVP